MYADQDKLNEAEAMYVRALLGKEVALGPKHMSTLDTVNNLGVLYKNQGKHTKAEAMYVRCYKDARRRSDRSTHRHSARSTTWVTFTLAKASIRRRRRCTCGHWKGTRRQMVKIR
jgi:hypothetical protein